MTTSLARLVFPSLRWRTRTGFAHERPKIDAALARGVGGFIVFQGTRDVVAALTRDLRQQAGRPLLIGSDLERGAAQQFPDLTDMPTPAALGFVDDPDATHAVALMTAREARAVGINWNFAPVCDLDLEPRNPIVQTRAFGADPLKVGRHAAAYVCGSQEHGVLVCAKHYPGHGRTTVDSHETLPVVSAPKDELQRVDVQPFAHAIGEGVGSVMTAHVSYPAWAPGNRAATFAPEILGYLRDPLKFEGVVVTDALIMGGALAVHAETDATVAAVAAGCDALLYPRDFGAVVTALDGAVRKAIPVIRADDALARYERAVAAWGRGDVGPSEIDQASHQAFADSVADRAMYVLRGELPKLAGTVEVSIVDDDVGGPYTVGPRDVFEKTLRDGGARVVQRAAGNVQRLIALYSEPRSWKNRADLGERTVRALRALGPRASLVVLFGHPRLASQIPGSVPVLCAWHGQPLMQRAAGRCVTRNA